MGMCKTSGLFGLLLVMLVSNIPSQCLGVQQQPSKELSAFKKEIKRRVARDQAARTAYLKHTLNLGKKGKNFKDDKRLARLVKRANEVDANNIAWIKNQIKRFGFPRVSEIGSETADGFFLLLIHADRDREFQKRCVEQMKEMPDEWAQSYVDKLVLRRNLTANMNLKQDSDTTTEKPTEKQNEKQNEKPTEKPTEKQNGKNPTNGQSSTEETPVDADQPVDADRP